MNDPCLRIDLGKHELLGVRVDAINYAAAVDRVIQAARHQRPLAVSAVAVHGLMTGVLDPQHRWRLNRFEMLVPDGQPVRWALNAIYRLSLTERVYGPTLMFKVCQRAAREGISIFLFGGTVDLLQELSRRLVAKFPKLRIAGVMPSRFRRMSLVEREEMISQIRASGAELTFVGLGCPRQEVWAHEFKGPLSMPLIAVGAAFSFHAGHVPQAPPAMQAYGLEWAYRLMREPGRLWRRYLFLNPLYAGLIFLQWMGFSPVDTDAEFPPTEDLLYG